MLINGVSKPPRSPVNSNKTKQSREKSNTAGVTDAPRREFQPRALRDAAVYPTQRVVTCNHLAVAFLSVI